MKRFESMIDVRDDRAASTASSKTTAAGSDADTGVCRQNGQPNRLDGHFSLPGADPQPICLVAPEAYEPNYAYPLFVWLHAPQGTEREICQVIPRLSTRNYAAVGVRGPVKCPQGFDWEGATGSDQDRVEKFAAQATDRVLQAVDRAEAQYNVNPERIFLAGFHRGGSMASRIALMYPDRFAGAISINGPLPEGSSLLQRWRSARRVQLLACMGLDATYFTQDMLCGQLPWVHTAGLNLHVRQYPGGNDLTTAMLADINAWMMERVSTAVIS